MFKQWTSGAVGLLLFCSLSGWAQRQSGDIEGFARDATAAYIPGVSISIASLDTGAQRSMLTDDRGYFLATLLPLGEYEVRAELAGFRPAVQRILVRQAERSSLNLTLQIGTVTDEVTVTETLIPLVNTTDAQIHVSIDEKRVQDLPLSNRNPLILATLSPGIVPVAMTNPFLSSGSFNTNGGRGRGNNITIDNIVSTDVSTTGSAGFGTLSSDAIREFKLITNNFNAEFGRNANAQVQIITKSGTKEFHGTAYNFLQNDKLNARDWFDTTGRASVIRRNQFGATAGGPILPDRLFFFGHYEGIQTRGAGQSVSANVPSTAQLAAVTDPTSRAILNAAGLPDGGATGRIQQTAPNATESNAWSARLDHSFNEGRDTVTGRYAFQDSTISSSSLTFLDGNLAGWGADSTNRPQNFGMGWTHVFGPRVVNEARVAFGRSNPNFTPQNDSQIPRIVITGFDRFGTWEGLPQGRVQNTFQYSDTLAWTRGRHNLKFGADVHRIQSNSVFDVLTRSMFSFASWDDFAAGRPMSYSQRFGGTVRGFRVSNYFFFAQDDFKVTPDLTLNLGFRVEVAGGVSEVNDILSNLDSRQPGPIGGAPEGPLGSFRLGGSSFDTNYNYQPRIGFAWNPDRGRWVVRGGYGITHDFIFLNPITNLRALPPFIQSVAMSGVASFTGAHSFANLVAGQAPIQADGRAAVGQFSSTQVNFGTVAPVDTRLKNPQVQQFNLTVEHEVNDNIGVKVGYVGTLGRYLLRGRQLNMIPPHLVTPAVSPADEIARLADFQAVFAGSSGSVITPSNRIDPRFNSVTLVEGSANSSYHGLQVEVNKRYSRGYQFQVSYTWSKSIDDASDVLGVLVNDNPTAQNPFNLSDNKGLSQFDIPHRLVVNHIYEPQIFSGLGGFSGKLLHGWAWNGIFQIQSGFPLNVFGGPRLGISDSPLSGSAANVARATVVGDLSQLKFAPSGSSQAALIPAAADRGVNSAASHRNANTSNYPLVQPLLGNYGTLGRNSLRLNPLTQFDWAAIKNTAVSEHVDIQFRAEFFNIFNNTSFAGLINNLADSRFGTYTRTDTEPRQIQLGLKLIW